MHGVRHVAIFLFADLVIWGRFCYLLLQITEWVVGAACHRDDFQYDTSDLFCDLLLTCRFLSVDKRDETKIKYSLEELVVTRWKWDILPWGLLDLHSEDIVKTLSWASVWKQRCNKAIWNGHWLEAGLFTVWTVLHCSVWGKEHPLTLDCFCLVFTLCI